MAFDVTSAIPMTRSLSALISGASDDDISNALVQHAIPRIRLALMSATGSDGSHVFYVGLDDLSDATKASTASSLVEAVFNEPVVSDGLRRVGSALAASWIINSRVGIIESQQKIAYMLEKQAMSDLDRICKSPILKSAVDSARDKLEISLSVPSSLFIALAPMEDQTSVDNALASDAKQLPSYDGAVKPFAAAAEAGRLTININGFSFQTQINEGDTPTQILARLQAGYDATDPSLKPNANLAITETAPMSASRNVQYTNIDGAKVISRFNFITSGAQMSLVGRNYDKAVDVIVLTAFLEKRDETSGLWVPGTQGLIYGITDSPIGLTAAGPHSIAVDLKTGLATKSTVTDAEEQSQLIRETFVFQVGTGDGLTTTDGELKYVVNDHTERVVLIPAGSDANRVAELVAQDLATQVPTQRLVGAVRPVTKLQPIGSPISMPTLELVAVNIDLTLAKIVMTITASPAEVLFGVSPNNVASAPNFDARAKSVIVTCVIGKATSTTVNEPLPSWETRQGAILMATHVPTPGLKKILDSLKDRRGF